MIKTFINPKGHQNQISGSKVTAILLKWRILPIGGASAGEGLRLQPVQQACFYIFLRGALLTSVDIFLETVLDKNMLKKGIKIRKKFLDWRTTINQNVV